MFHCGIKLAVNVYCIHCSNQLDPAKVLLDAGVDVNTKNRKGNTPIMVTAAVGNYKLLKFFASHPKINLHAQVLCAPV